MRSPKHAQSTKATSVHEALLKVPDIAASLQKNRTTSKENVFNLSTRIITIAKKVNRALYDIPMLTTYDVNNTSNHLLLLSMLQQLFLVFPQISVQSSDCIEVVQCINSISIALQHFPVLDNFLCFLNKMILILQFNEEKTEPILKTYENFLKFNSFSDFFLLPSTFDFLINIFFSDPKVSTSLSEFFDMSFFVKIKNCQCVPENWSKILILFKKTIKNKKLIPKNNKICFLKYFIFLYKTYETNLPELFTNSFNDSFLNSVFELLLEYEEEDNDAIPMVFSSFSYFDGKFNSDVLNFISSHMKSDPAKQNKAFLCFLNTILYLLKVAPNNIEDLDSGLSFCSILIYPYFFDQLIYNAVFEIFHLLTNLNYNKICSCVSTLLPFGFSFKLLSMKHIIQFFGDIEKLLFSCLFITSKELINYGFLKYFLQITDVNNLVILLKSCFLTVLLRCYSILKDMDLKNAVFAKVYQNMKSNTKMIVEFLRNGEILENVLKKIKDEKDEELFQILSISLSLNSDYFFKVGGLSWFNELLNDQTFDDELLIRFFITLSNHVKEISCYFTQQHINHRLFTLPAHILKQIAPICPPVYAHLSNLLLSNLKQSEIYSISYYGIDEFIKYHNNNLQNVINDSIKNDRNNCTEFRCDHTNIYNSKMLASAANRFIRANQLLTIMKDVDDLSSFIDLSADNFSFFKFSKDNYGAIEIKEPKKSFKSISFWFKTEEEVKSTQGIIMISNIVTISVSSGKIVFLLLNHNNENNISFECETKKWHFIGISIGQENVRIQFNSVVTNSINQKFEDFSQIIFSFNKIQYYVGSAIRLYSYFVTNFDYIYFNFGADNEKYSCFNESMVVTPCSISGCKCSIPYRGAMTFLRSTRFMSDFLEVLLNEINDPIKVNNIVKFMITSYIGNKGKIGRFWNIVVHVLIEKHQSISKHIFFYIIETFVNDKQRCVPKSYIFANAELWKYYNNNLVEFLISKDSIQNLSLAEYITLFFHFHTEEILHLIIQYVSTFPTIENLFIMKQLLISLDNEFALVLINLIISHISLSYIPHFSNVFSIEILTDFLLVFPINICDAIIRLMSVIIKNEKVKINNPILFTYSLLKSLKAPQIYFALFSFCTNITYSSFNTFSIYYNQKVTDNQFSSIIISIFFISFLVYRSTNIHDQKEYIEFLGYYEEAVKLFLSLFNKNHIMFDNMECLIFYINIGLCNSLSDLHILDIVIPEKHKNTIDYDFILQMWEIPTHLKNRIPQSDGLNQMFPTALNPFLSTIVQFSPFEINLENNRFLGNTHIPSFFFDFIRFLILSFIDCDDNFFEILKVIVYRRTLSSEYKIFCQKIISSLFSSPKMIMVSSDYMRKFYQFIINCITKKYFDMSPKIIYQSLLPFISIYLKQTNSANSFYEIRVLIMLMFKSLKSEDCLEIFTFIEPMMSSFKTIFDEFTFLNSFFNHMFKFPISNDQRYHLLLTKFVNTFLNDEDSFLRKWACIESTENLGYIVNFYSALKTFVGKGNIAAFSKWINSNPQTFRAVSESYEKSNFDKEFENTEFCNNKRDRNDSESEDNSDSSFTDYELNNFITELANSQQKTHFLFVNLRSLFKFVADYKIRIMILTYKKEKYFINHFPKDFIPNSYFLSQNVWPYQVPRVLVPSCVSFDENNVLTSFSVAKCNYSKDGNVLINLFIHVYSLPFDNKIKSSISTCANKDSDENNPEGVSSNPIPMIFSSISCSNINSNTNNIKKLRFVSAYSVYFLKIRLPIQSVLFEFNDRFFILLFADLGPENELNFIEMDDSLLYKALVEIFELNYFSVSVFCSHFVLSIEYKDIITWRPHSVNNKSNSFAINTICNEFIIAFKSSDHAPQFFLKNLNLHSSVNASSLPKTPIYENMGKTFNMNKNALKNKNNMGCLLNHQTFLFMENLQSACSKWSLSKMTSFEYLLILNANGSRSFSDMSQYPIFPWIMADYKSSDIPTTLRDLSRPMGQLDEGRAKCYDCVFSSENYYYGSHYSMSSIVHFFLSRIPPFTYYEWDLHSGWDHKARLFSSLDLSWSSASSKNNNDIRELTPEFFTFPDFFRNCNNFKIGCVELPKWAQSPEHYINLNRQKLEESEDLNKWIDLIFGFKETGESAIIAKNVFFPVSYHHHRLERNTSPLNSISSSFNSTEEDEVDEDVFTMQLQHWGQCPVQLFKKPHISKCTKILTLNKIPMTSSPSFPSSFNRVPKQKCNSNLSISSLSPLSLRCSSCGSLQIGNNSQSILSNKNKNENKICECDSNQSRLSSYSSCLPLQKPEDNKSDILANSFCCSQENTLNSKRYNKRKNQFEGNFQSIEFGCSKVGDHKMTLIPSSSKVPQINSSNNRNSCSYPFIESALCSIKNSTLSVKFGENIFVIKKKKFSFVRNCKISTNNVFIVLDTEMNITFVYRILYKNNTIPYDLIKVGEYISSKNDFISVVNGTDFLCASFLSKEIVIWDFIRSSKIRTIDIDFEDTIFSCFFDEYHGWIWIVAQKTIAIFSINGVKMHTLNMNNENVTASFRLDVPNFVSHRPVFVGFSGGEIEEFVFNIFTNEIETIAKFKTFGFPIVSFTCDRNLLALDSNGVSYAI